MSDSKPSYTIGRYYFDHELPTPVQLQLEKKANALVKRKFLYLGNNKFETAFGEAKVYSENN